MHGPAGLSTWWDPPRFGLMTSSGQNAGTAQACIVNVMMQG